MPKKEVKKEEHAVFIAFFAVGAFHNDPGFQKA
jgi:hypothetical protein